MAGARAVNLRPYRLRTLGSRGAFLAIALLLFAAGCSGDDRSAPAEPEGAVSPPAVVAEEEPAAPTTAPVEDAPAPVPAEDAAPARRELVPERRCDDCVLVDPAFTAQPGATAYFGVIDGAAYRIEVPLLWNGVLILWAHGFGGLNADGAGFNPELDFEEPEFLRRLAPLGSAWAASTYRANGYVPAVGVDDLLKVKDRFIQEVGQPRVVYVAGGSMGGATAQLMAQEFPEEIGGALALCGALSNVEVVDYLASWHAVAEWLIGAPPPRFDSEGMLEWAAPLGSIDAAGDLRLTPLGEQFAAVIRALTGGDRWAFLDGLGEQWNENFRLGALFWPVAVATGLVDRPGAVIAHVSSLGAFDTVAIVYAGDPPGLVDEAALNAEVIRFAASAADRRNPAWGVATGQLGVPLLTLKGTADLYTPISLDAAYQARVRAAGAEEHLVMRAVRHAGHCNFSEAEVQRTLLDFIAWVERGLVPAGEDLTGDLTAAGVAFTDPFDPGDPLVP